MEWKRLRGFSTPDEAAIAEGALREHGVMVRSGNTVAATIMAYAQPAFPVELWTPAEQFAEATQILGEFDRQLGDFNADGSVGEGSPETREFGVANAASSSTPILTEKQKQFRRAYQTGVLGTFILPGVSNILSLWFWVRAFSMAPRGWGGRPQWGRLALSLFFDLVGITVVALLLVNRR